MKNNCEIYLFRHGQTIWNLEKRFQGQKDSPLSPLGIEQSENMADKLMEIKPDVIVTSTLKRAKDTAKIALNKWGRDFDIFEMEELKESAFGVWEGMRVEDVMRDFPHEFDLHRNHPSLFNMDGAESPEDVQKRGIRGLKKIAALFQGKRVVGVTHGMLMQCVLSAIRKIPLEKAREKIQMPDNTDYVRIDLLDV